MALAILVTPSFARVVKKLHPQDKAVLDTAVQAIASSPALGEEKRGDLNGVFVYKFKLNKQETLLFIDQIEKIRPINEVINDVLSYLPTSREGNS